MRENWGPMKMTDQIRDNRNVQIETDKDDEVNEMIDVEDEVNEMTDNEDEVGFLGFDEEENLLLQVGDTVAGEEEATDVQDVIEMTEEPTRVPYGEARVEVESPTNFME
uniref:Uncharacterized protein n=1 Tax=Glossina morsitans morsitans TaxID=37546 RepID=A0A1B0FRB2_GLOMM